MRLVAFLDSLTWPQATILIICVAVIGMMVCSYVFGDKFDGEN